MCLRKAINFTFVLAVLGLCPVLAADELASAKYGSWGFDEPGMDRTISPGADFNAYVSGAWLKSAAIPPDLPAFGVLDQLFELNNARVHAILEDAAAGKVQDRDAAKIAAFYRAFMDKERADKLDYKPL